MANKIIILQRGSNAHATLSINTAVKLSVLAVRNTSLSSATDVTILASAPTIK